MSIFEYIKNKDTILIFGRCGEDGIIGSEIARRWTNVTRSSYGRDNVSEWNCSDSRYPPVIKHEGSVHITTCNNQAFTLSLKDLRYDLILVIVGRGVGFGPDIIYQKVYESFWLIKQLYLIDDVTTIIRYLYLLAQLIR
jgi:hypothetical protein